MAATTYEYDTFRELVVEGLDWNAGNLWMALYSPAFSLNTSNLAYAELSGRSHGGGVLELMPNEVEEIMIPFNKNNSEMVGAIDSMMRGKKSIESILEMTTLPSLISLIAKYAVPEVILVLKLPVVVCSYAFPGRWKGPPETSVLAVK